METPFILRFKIIRAVLLFRRLGASGEILGATWSGPCCPRVTGGIRAMCGAISYVAQGSWGLGDVLGATWSGIGLSWMPLEPIGEGLGGLLGSSLDSWEGLGGLLRRSWDVLEWSWSPLPLPPALGDLGPTLPYPPPTPCACAQNRAPHRDSDP